MNSYWCYGDLARANWGKCHIVVNLGQRVYATTWWEDWQDNKLRFLATRPVALTDGCVHSSF
jgi:hypothetical protein